MNNFLKDLSSVGLSKGFMVVFGLVTSIIIARTLGPEKNGLIASLLVYPGLFMTIGSLGIQQSTTYFIGKGIYTDEQVKRAITQIWFFSTVFSLISCFLLIRYLSNAGENLTYVLLALVPIPFSLFNTYNSGFFLGKNQIRTFNKINWIPSLIILIFTVLLVIIFSFKINGYLIALAAGPIFIAIILLFKNKFIDAFSLEFDWDIIKKMLSLGLIYAFALLIMNLNYRLDIILLDLLSTNFETGIYSKGSNITQYLWQIPMLMGTIVFSRSAVSKDDHAFSKKVAQLLRLSVLIIVLASIVLVVFSDLIIIGMFGEEFKDSISVLNYLIGGVVLLTIFKVMNMDLAGKGLPWVSLKAMVPALAINVLFNFILIPDYGADGAAIASTISYSFAGLLFLHFYSVAAKLPIKEIITYKRTDFNPIIEIIKKFKK